MLTIDTTDVLDITFKNMKCSSIKINDFIKLLSYIEENAPSNFRFYITDTIDGVKEVIKSFSNALSIKDDSIVKENDIEFRSSNSYITEIVREFLKDNSYDLIKL